MKIENLNLMVKFKHHNYSGHYTWASCSVSVNVDANVNLGNTR